MSSTPAPFDQPPSCSRCNRPTQQLWASDWTEAHEADPSLPSYGGCTGLCTTCFAAWYGCQPRAAATD